MPTFDYKCQQCRHVFEVQTPARTSRDIFPCPYCGGCLVKLPAAPAFVVKGYNAKSGYSKKED